MCIDMCADMCVDMCIDMCADMCVDMCIYMCVDMCVDMCADMCVDMCIDMWILPTGVRADMWADVLSCADTRTPTIVPHVHATCPCERLTPQLRVVMKHVTTKDSYGLESYCHSCVL